MDQAEAYRLGSGAQRLRSRPHERVQRRLSREGLMYPYRLSPTPDPDFMVMFDASHAEAFNRTARAAGPCLGFMGQSKGTLGLLKTPQFYHVGPIDFTNNVVAGASVEEFGSHLMLPAQRSMFAELRSQLNGHVKAAMVQGLMALGVRSINLIFYNGGPLLLIPPAPNDRASAGRNRIATIRFEGASTIEQERHCVIANRSSKIAYPLLWHALDQQIQKHSEQSGTLAEDLLDSPPPDAPVHFRPAPTRPVHSKAAPAPKPAPTPLAAAGAELAQSLAALHQGEDEIDQLGDAYRPSDPPPETGSARNHGGSGSEPANDPPAGLVEVDDFALYRDLQF
ncbi:hypothetical protein [Sphingosinicella sp. BN140058]|uniref:hypothetical protein n=1 Tax=Sphingosinicella sp. BN140058 TaxID=1892855 RepID=UPI0010133864|nr:hypothetical protein [Sphingosinicella sp. BN140058]QAY80136.1 hypothetical protein ETR14_26195 [Sphingosinicella sp. BN140058]